MCVCVLYSLAVPSNFTGKTYHVSLSLSVSLSVSFSPLPPSLSLSLSLFLPLALSRALYLSHTRVQTYQELFQYLVSKRASLPLGLFRLVE